MLFHSSRVAESVRDLYNRVLGHMVRRVAATPAEDAPFSHFYVEDFIPADVYGQLLAQFPDQEHYSPAAERHYSQGEGQYVRSMFALTAGAVEKLPAGPQALWRAVAAALAAPQLKQVVYAKLARDLAFRYGVHEADAAGLKGHSRPTLYRETEGFEIPPHPDTRKKVVTMHLYLPEDLSQRELGTALYKRRPLALPLGGWRHRFAKVKQFDFRPNSGYAFVVNNTLTKKSWHGREELPPGAGVRNTLLNTFYETPRDGYSGYLPDEAPARKAA